jgi:NAD(P)H-hydrate epimerase
MVATPAKEAIPMREPFWLAREEVRELDRRAIQEFGIPSLILMENAGRGAAEIFVKHFAAVAKSVLILCGAGNNGGDGFVIARHLDRLGFPVQMILFADVTNLSVDCRVNFEIARRSGIPIHASDAFESKLNDSTAVIDALFGSGLNRPLGEPFASVIETLNRTRLPTFAVDLPSGLDCDTGEPLGPTVQADRTVTFVGWKKGFLNPNSRTWTGLIETAEIGAPRVLVEEYRRRG